MSTNSKNPQSELRKFFWPIEMHENKKFLPMAGMMFFILFNYAMLRSIKDGFVVTNIGAEAISFLKTYFVLPSAILAMVIYVKLCNVMSAQKVFYSITGFFVSYILFFALFVYPNPEMVHPNPETIEQWSASLPALKWFIRIFGKWSFATFYIMAELWGSIMLSLLFWQFANQITKSDEAKRFYGMFGLLGNVGLLFIDPIGTLLIKKNILGVSMPLIPVMLITAISGVLIMLIYRWINANVLTDPKLYDPEASGSKKKKKAKLSLMESFKFIFSSKYIGFIAILVLSYGISINLVEGVWKAQIKKVYTTDADYTAYMFAFQTYQGLAAIIFMLVGSNILRRVSWGTAASFTPIMILVTGFVFFGFIFFGEAEAGPSVALGVLASSPVQIAITVGMIQNVLSKATKYSLFDSTKEMAYIPLDEELKTKGKAAVDVVGGRLGKSGGGFIQSTTFMILPLISSIPSGKDEFATAMPFFGVIFFVIVILWLFGVKALQKEYNNLVKDHTY